MKYWMLLLVTLLSVSSTCSAQTFEEWFRQKNTQRKYLLQQIAAFQLYLGYLKKGYNIVKDGTTTIGNITGGEFSLHETFLGSLQKVNPKIRDHAKVADVIAGQARIVATCKTALARAGDAGCFSPAEIELFVVAISGLLDGAAGTVSQLTALLTNGHTALGDAERLYRIDKLCTQSRQQRIDAGKLYREIDRAATGRQRTLTEIKAMKKIYGIK